MANSAVVGTLRALLSADTAEFVSSMGKGADAADKFQKQLTQAGQTFQEAGIRMGALKSIILDFSGALDKRKAEEYAVAIEKIGGISKLTAEEQRKVNQVMTDALEKYRVLGKEAPPYMVALAKATEQAGPATKNLTDQIRAAIPSASSLAQQIKATALGYVTGAVSVQAFEQAISQVVSFVKDSISAYAQAEAAQNKLNTALKAQGQSAPQVIGLYNQLAKTFQQTTVFSDDLITEMQALLVQVGQVAPKDMEVALKAATDLAAGLGIDLRSATMLVAKAFEDNFAALKKAGVVIDETKAKAEGMTYVLQQIEQRFGGQAQEQLNTYTGKLERLKNQYNDLQEAVGGALVETGALQSGISTLGAVLLIETAKLQGFVNLLKEMAFWSDYVKNPQQAANQAFKDAAASLDTAIKAAQAGAQALGPQGLSGAAAGSAESVKKAADALKTFDDANKASEEKIRAAVKAWDAYNAEIQKGADVLTGKALAEEIKKLNDEVERAGKQGGIAADQLGPLGKRLDDMVRQGGQLTPVLAEIHAQWVLQRGILPGVAQDLDRILKILPQFKLVKPELFPPAMIGLTKELMNAIKATAFEWGELEKKAGAAGFKTRVELQEDVEAARKLIDEMRKSGKYSDEELAKAEDKLREAEDRANESLQKRLRLLGQLSGTLGTLSGVFSKLAQVSSGSFGTVAQEIAEVITAWDLATKAAIEYTNATTAVGKAAALASGVAAIAQVTGSGSTAKRVAGGAVSGAQIGTAILPGWGTAIGAGVGALVGYIRSRGSGRKMVEEFATQFGGFDKLRDKLNALGDEGEKLWVRLTQGVGRSNPEEAEKAINAVADALNAAAKKAQEAADKAAKVAEAQKTIGNSLAGVTAKVGIQAKAYGELKINLDEAQKAYAALVDAGADQSEIAAAAKDVEMAQQALGKATITTQKEFDRLSRIALNTFNTLVASGVSSIDAMERVGTSVDDLIANAKTFGLAGNAAFQELSRWRELTQANAPLLEEVGSLNELMMATATLGGLSASAFADMQAQGVEAYNQLTAAGFTQQEALTAEKPLLESILKLSKEQGYAIDDQTQALIDQAQKAGILKKEEISTNQILLDGIGALIKAVGGDLPESFKKFQKAGEEAASGVKKAIDDIPDSKDISVNYIAGDTSGFEPGSGIPTPTAPSFANEGFVKGAINAIVGDWPSGEYILHKETVQRLIAAANGGSRGEIRLPGVMLSGMPNLEAMGMSGGGTSDALSSAVGQPLVVENQIFLDGRRIADNQLRQIAAMTRHYNLRR